MADVKSPSFLIGNATVMMAPRSVDVFSLNPDSHSIGMVKAVTVGMEADTIDLRNGIQQNLVDQKRSGVRLTTTFEGYEFTAQNLFRALGYANVAIQRKRGSLSAAVAAGATSISVATDPIVGETASGITGVGDIPTGSTLIIQKNGQEDFAFPVRTSGAATGAGPYTVTLASAVPVGTSFAIGDRVWVVNELDVGAQKDTDFFGMKIVGTLSNDNVPVVVVFPKVKVVRGFNLNFSETDYSNLPFEVSPFFLAASEIPGGSRLAEIGTRVTGKAYIGA
jgi:hypothetical protein